MRLDPVCPSTEEWHWIGAGLMPVVVKSREELMEEYPQRGETMSDEATALDGHTARVVLDFARNECLRHAEAHLRGAEEAGSKPERLNHLSCAQALEARARRFERIAEMPHTVMEQIVRWRDDDRS